MIKCLFHLFAFINVCETPCMTAWHKMYKKQLEGSLIKKQSIENEQIA